MALILLFLCGMGNFAMHKAVLESRHPFVEETRRHFGAFFGQRSAYLLEYALLLGAMLLGAQGYVLATLIYGSYTGFNALATWLILTGRV